jgi:hypothetical protein
MREYQSLSHTRWNCKYHVVFIPKRRRKVMFGNANSLNFLQLLPVLSLLEYSLYFNVLSLIFSFHGRLTTIKSCCLQW